MGSVPVSAPRENATPGATASEPQTEEQRLAALCGVLCSPLSTCEEGYAHDCVSECFGGLVRPGCTGRYADVIECLIETPLGDEYRCSPFGIPAGAQCAASIDALHACDENPEPLVPGPVGAPANPSCAVTLSSTSTTCEQVYTCAEATLRAACELRGDDWSCSCLAEDVLYSSAGIREPVVPRGSPCEQAGFACGMSY